MTEAAALLLPGDLHRATRLALVSASVGLLLGGAALWLGGTMGAVGLWGFGAACLLLVPTALSVHGRVREGLGNRGLERERLAHRIVSHMLRLLALGVASAAAIALLGNPLPDPRLEPLGLAVLAMGLLTTLWLGKRGLAELHPTLGLDAARTRTLLELAALLFAGSLLGRWLAWAPALAGLAMALRLFQEGQRLAKGSALPPACGGCGSGCGCG